MTKARGWSEYYKKIVRIIPGMKGYQDKNSFRDSDKAVRLKLVEQLTEVKDTLDKAKTDLVDEGKIADLDIIDRAVNKVDRVRETIRYDSYGYSGYFDDVLIREPELEKMYQFDLDLFGGVENLQRAADMARTRISGGEGVKKEVKAFEEEIEAFEMKLKERKNFKGIGE